MQRDMKPQHTHTLTHTNTHTSWQTKKIGGWSRICIQRAEAGFAGDILNCQDWTTARFRCVFSVGTAGGSTALKQPCWLEGLYQSNPRDQHIYINSSCLSRLSYLSVPENVSHLHHHHPPLSVSMASFHLPPFLFYSKLLCILEPGIRRKTFPIWDEESACLHRCPEIAGLWV